jgi:hypothetical protein
MNKSLLLSFTCIPTLFFAADKIDQSFWKIYTYKKQHMQTIPQGTFEKKFEINKNIGNSTIVDHYNAYEDILQNVIHKNGLNDSVDILKNKLIRVHSELVSAEDLTLYLEKFGEIDGFVEGKDSPYARLINQGDSALGTNKKDARRYFSALGTKGELHAALNLAKMTSLPLSAFAIKLKDTSAPGDVSLDYDLGYNNDTVLVEVKAKNYKKIKQDKINKDIADFQRHKNLAKLYGKAYSIVFVKPIAKKMTEDLKAKGLEWVDLERGQYVTKDNLLQVSERRRAS